MGDRSFVDGLRRRLLTQMVLRSSLRWLSAWAFGWGLAVLVLRAGFGVRGGTLAWGGLMAVPLVAAAWLAARRKMPTAAALTALLDRTGGHGGLMMAEAEVDVGAWKGKMRTPTLPDVKWEGGRSWKLLGVAAAFVVIGFAIPEKMIQIAARPLDLGDAAGRIAQQIDALEKEKVIDPKQAEDLKARLGQVREQAVASDPAKSWEAMDQLRDSMTKAAAEAAEAAVNQTQKLAQAGALAEALNREERRATPSLDPAATAEALASLAKTLDELKEENAAIQQSLANKDIDPGKLNAPKGPGDLKQLLASKKLDPKKLDALKKAMEKLHIDPKQLGLLDPEALKKLKDSLDGSKLDPSEREGLEKELKENGSRSGDTPEVTPEQLDQLRDELEKLGIDPSEIELLDPDEKGSPGLSPEELKQLQQLTPEQLEQLKKIAGACRRGKLATGEMLKRLADEGLIDPSQLEAALKAGAIDPDELAAMLAAAGADPSAIAAALRMTMRGNGGPGGGGGPTPLTWNDPASEAGVKFKQTALPPQPPRDMKQSQVVGVSLGAPAVNSDGKPDSTGALAQAHAGGGSAATQAILPRHRAVVEQYFKRP